MSLYHQLSLFPLREFHFHHWKFNVGKSSLVFLLDEFLQEFIDNFEDPVLLSQRLKDVVDQRVYLTCRVWQIAFARFSFMLSLLTFGHLGKTPAGGRSLGADWFATFSTEDLSLPYREVAVETSLP